jgi:mRNA-degrading endonuclease toxin of MazEF toxin-antitoxin module
MLTNKNTFSDDLLNTVRGILGEAKKHTDDCECEKCEAEEMEEGHMPTTDEPTDANKKTADKVRAMMVKEKKPVKEEYASAAQRKAVWANRADGGAGHPDKKKKLKEAILEMVNEASDGLSDKAKKSGVSLSTLKKVYARGIAAWNSGHRPGTTPQQWAHARVNSYITKGKGTYHGADKDLRSEGTDMPFEGPYKKVGERKDEYGNKVKNIAKYLAKKAMNKQKNEEVEQIDELSKKTLGSYIGTASADKSFAAHDVGAINQIAQSTGTTASDREEREQLNKRHAKRSSGIGRAVDKLTKEEQDFVDSLNNEIFEKADPYDIAGMIKKAKAKNDPNHPAMKHVAAIEDIKKHGGALSVQGDHVRSLIKALGEDAEITEARGRPKKGVAKDFTIHPKTKEKLMHNNPEHMKKIEVLQKNGILEKPKAEADEHVMNQLRKAKTSMLGGSKINFTHGDSKEVSGTHAAKILTKYAGMRPNEKEDFQKFVSHSHENLMKHV